MKYPRLVCCLGILYYDCFALEYCSANVAAPLVRLYPELLIVPVNTSVLLTCEVCYSGSYFVHWYRDSATVPFHRSDIEENNSILNYTLFVTSEYKNTEIVCTIAPIGRNSGVNQSNVLILNAISEAGVEPNPLVETLVDESPAFYLKWSPPFIWGAFPIHYCVVSIIRTNESDSVHYGNNKKVIAESPITFIESGIMSLIESFDDSQSHQTCTEITFVIMAFNQKNDFHNKSVSVTGRYPAGLGNFSESAINTVVASDAINQKLLVRIEIELPSLCNFQKMNYTISIDSATGSTIFVQTFYHTGSGTVCHDINQDDVDGLELNKNYTLKVIASTDTPFAQPVEGCHEFNTNGAYGTECKDYLLVVLLTILASIF